MSDFQREEYHRDGFTVIDDVVTTAADWRDLVLASPLLSAVYTPQEKRTVAAGEGYNLHRVLDRFETDATLPTVRELYRDVLERAKEIAGPQASSSPYARSAYYVKVYDPPAGQQGWHFDTNDVSGVLYLTSHTQSGATVVTSLDGVIHRLQPRAGSLLLLQGTKCWHRADAVLDRPKITLLLNYYLGTPAPRHPELDTIIFGSSEPRPGLQQNAVEANP